jgi:hypothetical protein
MDRTKAHLAIVMMVALAGTAARGAEARSGLAAAPVIPESLIEPQTPQPAETPAVVKEGYFRVRADSESLARQVVDTAANSLQTIRQHLLPEADLTATVDIYVWSDAEEYHSRAPHAPVHSSACAISTVDEAGQRVHRIDLLHDAAQSGQKMFTARLPHELTHVLQEEYFRPARGQDLDVPLAIQEGLSIMAEQGDKSHHVQLAGTALAGPRAIPLQQLLLLRRYDQAETPALFYAESYSFMEFLRGKMTRGQYGDFLGHLRSGEPVDEAVRLALAMPQSENFLQRLDVAWRNYAILQNQLLQVVQDSAQPDDSDQAAAEG